MTVFEPLLSWCYVDVETVLSECQPVWLDSFWMLSPHYERSTKLPVKWVPWVLSLGVKRLECDAGHSSQPNAELKNEWSYTSVLLLCHHGTHSDIYLF
jgi:hypothetical protein